MLNGTSTSANDRMTVTGDSNMTLDVPGDGRRAVWAGTAFAQIYLQANAASDLSVFSNNHGALVFKGVVNAATTATLTAQTTCVYPCRGTVDITGLLGPVGQKTTFKIPLACFVPAEAGLDFTNIDAPFQLQTTQAIDFTFGEVQWVQNAALDPDAAHCATPGVATRAQVEGNAFTRLVRRRSALSR
jgi:beta-glucosidase